MGHIRLGRLPKTLPWGEVIGLLETEPNDAASIASATVRAADARLRKLANDPSLTYSVWLLVRVMTAARSDNFHAELNGLGIPVSGETSSLGLVAQIGDRARDELAQFGTSGHVREIAAQALRQTLHETVLQTSADMFMASSQDAQRALRSYSTQARFGDLLRRYFATFMSRTLRSVVERELANHVGRGHAIANASDSAEFLQQLDRHVWQVSRIVEDFSGGWYSKRNWETGGEITQAETQRFVAHALHKFRTDLKEGRSRDARPRPMRLDEYPAGALARALGQAHHRLARQRERCPAHQHHCTENRLLANSRRA